MLVGDACLFTAAAFYLLALLGGFIGIVIGPMAAWLYHGRRLDKTSVLSGVFGLLIGVGVVGGFLLLVPFALNALGVGDDSDFTVPIVLLSVIGSVFGLLLVWMGFDGLRDLMPGRRLHTRLDIVRLIAIMLIVAGSLVVLSIQTTSPETEMGTAAVFALAAAVTGGLTMFATIKIQARRSKTAAV